MPATNRTPRARRLCTLAAAALATSALPAQADPTGIESPVYVSSAVEFPGGRSTFYAPHGVGSRVAQGSLAGVDAGGVELAGTHWPVAFFSSLTARPHYLIVTSGDYNGMSVMITGTDSATNYIALAEDISSEIIGTESFRIREALTLDDMFGPLNEAGLTGGTSFLMADVLVLRESGSNTQTTIFNYAATSFNAGWVTTTRARTPSGMRSILPYQIVEARRNVSSNNPVLHFQQQLRDESLLVPVHSGNNFVGLASSDSLLNLALSGLETVLTSGTSSRNADFVGMYKPSYMPIYLVNGTWRNMANGQITPNEPFDAGRGVILSKRLDGTILWEVGSDLN